MKTLFVNRNIIVLIFTVMMLICGIQGISYSQEDSPPTVTASDNNTSVLKVSFEDFLYNFDENAYQVQLRRKTPQGDWITQCGVVRIGGGGTFFFGLFGGSAAGTYVITVTFTDLEPGTTYEARYRDTNLSECHDNPPAPDPWSAIGEGTTPNIPDSEIIEVPDANLNSAVRKALDIADRDDIRKVHLAQLTQLSARDVSNLTGLEHATQLRTLSPREGSISDLTPLAQLTQLTGLSLSDNNISDLTPLAQLTQLTGLSLSDNNISDLTPLAQLTQLTGLGLSDNNISDLTPLAQLTQLTGLDLGDNNISDLTPLAQLTLLTRLDLRFNNIIDVTPLAQLINLKSLFLIGNNISDITPLAQLSQNTLIYASYNPVNFSGSPSNIKLMTVSTPQPLTEATLNGSSVTLTLLPSGAAYDTSIDNIRNAMTLTGIDGVTVSDVIRVSDTELQVTLGYTGSLQKDSRLIFSLGAEAVSGYEGRALTGAIPVYPELGLTVSSSYPLSAATLNKNVVTLTLGSGAFEPSTYSISGALTISGITGITFYRRDVHYVSNTVVTIELTFKGSIDKDTVLTFTLGADAIRDYEGPALTAEIPVSASTEVAVTGELIASTEFPLTKATLNDSIVTLTLPNYKYEESPSNYHGLIIAISGIPGVSGRYFERTDNNKKIWVELSFEGNLDSDAMLTLTVPPSIIVDHYGPPLAATLPVTVKTGQQVLVPDSQRPSMFWINTERDKIESLEPFDAVTQQVTSLNVDTVGGKVYWSERGSDGGTIKRANLDGTSTESLVTLPTTPQSITVDTVRKKLYWGDTFEGKIQSVDLNGENITTIIQFDDIITHIAVDAEGAKLYWADSKLRIRRVNLDGTSIETPLTGWKSNRSLGVGGIAIADGKIYWTEQRNSSIVGGIIYRANLNGTNLETLATPQGTPTGVAVDTVNGKVYWANSHGGIQRTDINGGEIENVVYGITAPGDFALGAVSTQPTTPTTPETPTTDAVVSLSPVSVASPAIGQQIEFSLNIAGGETVAGYQATVQFDTTALRYVSGANGDFLFAGAFFVQPVVEGNLVKLNAVSLSGESNGDGTLAKITFEVIAVKASTLTLSDVLLTDNAGVAYVPSLENAEITEQTQLKGDVNGDGIVNIQDLVLVASNLGKTGQNAADINGDGVVNIQDLVLVAGALGSSAAAPPLNSHSLSTLTAADVKSWLSQAQHFNLTDATSQRGILFLEQLLVALTPKETALLHNYPNPFNPETWIPYHLSKDAEVTLHIYAVDGTLVRTLALGHQAAGLYQSRSRAAHWDGKNEFGESVASGLYFYTLTAGDFSATRKMLIRK